VSKEDWGLVTLPTSGDPEKIAIGRLKAASDMALRSRYDHNKILQGLRENHVECTAHKALLRFLHPQAQYQKRAGVLPAPQGCRCFEKRQETRRASLTEENHKTN
jgi:hypothetical protein